MYPAVRMCPFPAKWKEVRYEIAFKLPEQQQGAHVAGMRRIVQRNEEPLAGYRQLRLLRKMRRSHRDLPE